MPEPAKPWVVPEGWQYELWWPVEGRLSLVKATVWAARDEFKAVLDERIAAEPDADYQIWLSSGWDVYSGYKREDLAW